MSLIENFINSNASLSTIQELMQALQCLKDPLKVKLLTDNAVAPRKAHQSDAGYDICSTVTVTIPPQGRALVNTGVAIALPNSLCYARIAPRSGLSVKNGIDVMAGVVDSGYRGEIKVAVHNTDPDDSFTIHEGDRIAQLIVTMVAPMNDTEVVDDLDETERGEGGFGHTGA